MTAHRVVIFDSGMGGLTVAGAVRRVMPDAELIYAADTAAFPYGDWDEPMLVRRIVKVAGLVIDLTRPDAFVVACNTASTIALAELRRRYATPFVGTVPAIKPAAAATRSNIIGVLATPGTVRREYTQSLIHTYAYHCRVLLHGAPKLAELAERKLRGEAPDREELIAEITPVFRRKGDKRTDTVVLGCTHYPLLSNEIAAAAPWPVTLIDPSDAIAARTRSVTLQADPKPHYGAIEKDTVMFTARNGSGDDLEGYGSFGFSQHVVMAAES